ncbi:hypothetical protein DPMN_105916 [Dreissena polymorpha]|uniref:Uncharacterized protein n=1 Tax=Dreissena polymorpha TaxID=45954 RepID=A0A9D4K453_DREPO|nr:hypothetical protein DPMN_105916 [Dreissena polymorpha]
MGQQKPVADADTPGLYENQSQAVNEVNSQITRQIGNQSLPDINKICGNSIVLEFHWQSARARCPRFPPCTDTDELLP